VCQQVEGEGRKGAQSWERYVRDRERRGDSDNYLAGWKRGAWFRERVTESRLASSAAELLLRTPESIQGFG